MYVEREQSKPVSDDNDDNDDGQMIYSNLYDPDLLKSMGMSKTVEYFIDKLTALAITVPPRLIVEVRRDAELNVGNRDVHYSAAGAILSEA